MSKVTASSALTREAMPDAPDGEWLDTVLEKTNMVDDQVIKALQNGISIGDNTPWKFVPLNMVHGAQYKVKNPFDDPSVTPKIVSVSSAIGLTLGADGKPDGGQYTIQEPSIGWRPTGLPDNSVYITVQYAPPLGIAIASRTSAFSAPNGDAIVAHDTTELQSGLITHASGLFTCASAGIVQVTHSASFSSAAVGLNRASYFVKNNSLAKIYGLNVIVVANRPSPGGSDLITVAAGDTVQQNTGQDTGAPLALDVTLNRTRATVRYVAPDPATTAKVTLLFQGA